MKFYSILEGNTQDVLRRFLRLINKSIGRIGIVEATVDDLEDEVDKKATKAALKEVTDLIGDEETAATILYRIKALEDAANGGGTETTPAEETQPGEGG